jgi:3-oxoacyl-[acyl-carrier protein] reductase
MKRVDQSFQITETAAMIKEGGGRAIARTADVGNYGDVVVLFENANEAFGGIDIVVANAGVASDLLRIEDSDPHSGEKKPTSI